MADQEPVHGKITFPDGTPLKGGVIYFSPVEVAMSNGQVRFETASLVDGQGRYQLGFNGDGAGAPEGDYKVTIGPRDAMELKGSNSERIPAKYREKATTPLSAAVKEGDNTFDFVLR
jgi:hypothetical protein